MIAVRDISKQYDGGSGTARALDGVSLDVAAGEFVVVMGPSGAGKSTLLAAMGGLLRPSAGEVLLHGRSLWEIPARERAAIRARDLGFVFQNAATVRSLTALENVLLPPAFLPSPASCDRDRALMLLDRVGLVSKADAMPNELSGGEKRRVAIASALMNDPPVLLADEPTGDLDEKSEATIVEIFSELHAGGKAVVVVTHQPAFRSVAGRMVLLRAGRIVEDVE